MICQICGKECDGSQGLTSHASKTHGMTSKEYYDRFIKKPGEGICPNCGNPTNFIKFGRGYSKHCNYSCSSTDPVTNKQRNETYSLLHDRTEIMKSAYKRYEERTGYAHPSQNPAVKEQKYKTKMENYQTGKIKLGYVKSQAETEISNFIESLYHNTIVRNAHNIIPHRELDIYLPDIRKAIEYNGTYWHADPRFYNENDIVTRKHIPAKAVWNNDKDKQILCESYNIQLLTIWEYDYTHNKDYIFQQIKEFINII